VRRPLAAALLVAVGLLGLAPAAHAQSAARTGWWNTATVSGTALPSTTAPDELHLAQGPAGQLAFAAVSYAGLSYASAELVLHVAAGSQVGTPHVVACPTRDDTWKAGGDQPIDAAPAYDCAGRSASAVVGADKAGTTLTFLLDPTLQLAPGTTSLAVVPALGSAPFSLDLTAPNARSLSVVPVSAPVGVSPAPSAAPPSQAATDASPPPAGPGFAPGPGQAPFLTGPLSAVPAPAVAASALPPVVAAGQAPVSSVPVASVRLSTSTGRREAAVLLVAVVGALGYVVAQHRREPLALLGGRARAADPPVGAAGPARGIGRFARPRTTAARRLL
jgi:hypothetical protein